MDRNKIVLGVSIVLCIVSFIIHTYTFDIVRHLHISYKDEIRSLKVRVLALEKEQAKASNKLILHFRSGAFAEFQMYGLYDLNLSP